VSAIDTEVQGLGSLVSGFTAGVEQSNRVFSRVQTTTGDVVQADQAVSTSNQEIVEAAQATATAMRGIADLAERTAQLTQTSQSQSEQMEALSKQLLNSIRFFRLPGVTAPQGLANANSPTLDVKATTEPSEPSLKLLSK
jgi:methyl-accepting chemotaxis protein PixJ